MKHFLQLLAHLASVGLVLIEEAMMWQWAAAFESTGTTSALRLQHLLNSCRMGWVESSGSPACRNMGVDEGLHLLRHAEKIQSPVAVEIRRNLLIKPTASHPGRPRREPQAAQNVQCLIEHPQLVDKVGSIFRSSSNRAGITCPEDRMMSVNTATAAVDRQLGSLTLTSTSAPQRPAITLESVAQMRHTANITT